MYTHNTLDSILNKIVCINLCCWISTICILAKLLTESTKWKKKRIYLHVCFFKCVRLGNKRNALMDNWTPLSQITRRIRYIYIKYYITLKNPKPIFSDLSPPSSRLTFSLYFIPFIYLKWFIYFISLYQRQKSEKQQHRYFRKWRIKRWIFAANNRAHHTHRTASRIGPHHTHRTTLAPHRVHQLHQTFWCASPNASAASSIMRAWYTHF